MVVLPVLVRRIGHERDKSFVFTFICICKLEVYTKAPACKQEYSR